MSAQDYTETFTGRTNGLITTTTSTAAKPDCFPENTEAALTRKLQQQTGGTGGSYDYIICNRGDRFYYLRRHRRLRNVANTGAGASTSYTKWGYALLRGIDHQRIAACHH